MSKKTTNHYGVALAVLGLAVAGIELALYWTRAHPIHPAPMIVAAILFFVGGAIIDTQKAKEIGGVVVSSAVTIIGALPFGRRQTDKIANAGGTVVIPPTDEHAVAPPSKPVPSPTTMEGQ